MDKVERSFISGYLCAVQNMIATNSDHVTAEDLIRSLGGTQEQLIDIQQQIGYMDEDMIEIIKEAKPETNENS